LTQNRIEFRCHFDFRYFCANFVTFIELHTLEALVWRVYTSFWLLLALGYLRNTAVQFSSSYFTPSNSFTQITEQKRFYKNSRMKFGFQIFDFSCLEYWKNVCKSVWKYSPRDSTLFEQLVCEIRELKASRFGRSSLHY
jgi:hypothetical protein